MFTALSTLMMYPTKSGTKIYIGGYIGCHLYTHIYLNSFFHSLNNRVSLLEDVLEQLVTNMDTILNRVEKDLKSFNKNYKPGDSKFNFYET